MSTIQSAHHDDQAPILPGLLLLGIILIEGFVTISIEILTIRQLVPFVGNNVTVTSLIIGVFLLFLAYGYKRGGQYKRNFGERLTFNFTLSAFIAGIGLSYVFIDLFFLGFAKTINPHLLIVLCLYLLLITAPLVYLLGQTVPISMNLIKKTSTIGHVGGKVLHMSTIGSFLGAVLTSVLLIHTLGVGFTVFFNFILLFFLVFLLTFELKLNWVTVFVLAGFSVVIFKLNVEFESLAFLRTNNYANYALHETKQFYDKPGRILDINNTAASYINLDNQGFPYVERIKTLIDDDLNLKHQSILVLGAGGFTLSKGLKNPNQFTYVDIDPDLKNIVEEHFMDGIEGKVITQDARVFVRNTDKRYDFIVSDVYNNPSSIPSHLLTQEYYEALYRALKPQGTMVFNFIMNPTFSNDYDRRNDNTVRSVFKHCMNIPMTYTSEHPSNVLYVCRKFEEEDNLIYTDDLNLSEIDLPLPKR